MSLPFSQPNNRSGASSERLLAESRWIRALAGSLVRDPHLADDLAQDTWVLALEHAPSRDRSLTGWWATVLRNLARQEHRSSGRRTDREHQVARRERTPSTSSIVERCSVQRDVAQAVMDLEEPYRETIVLRYFEELPPRAIARRMGAPVSTVKTRLDRGLKKLRERLDERQGGNRSAWLSALLPIAGRSTPSLAAPLTLGVTAVSSKISVIVATLFVASGVYAFLALREQAPGAEAPVVVQAAAEEEASVELAGLETPASTGARAPVVSAPASEPASVVAESGTYTPVAPNAPFVVHGRVLDAEGRALAGVLVKREGDDEANTQSGPDGRFVLQLEGGRGSVVVDDERFTTVLAARAVSAQSEVEAIVVVAPRVSAAGRVVDELGRPISDARLTVGMPEGFRARIAEVLDYSIAQRFATATDVNGLFELAELPSVQGATLSVVRDGYGDAVEPAPATDTPGLIITLQQTDAGPDVLRGKVVDIGGVAVEGAYVSAGLTGVLTDGNGEFALDLGDPESWNKRFELAIDEVLAVKEGSLPASRSLPPDDPTAVGYMVLQLGAEPLSLEGRVVDSEGEPVEGANVWIADTTLLGVTKGRRRPAHLEFVLAGQAESGWVYQTTDASGSFRVDGLADREYTLDAMDPATLLRAEPITVQAGARAVELAFPKDPYFERVSGTVRTRHGKPLPGVTVATMCDTVKNRYKERVIGTRHAQAASTTTNAEGRFTLERVPKSLVYLRLDGESTIPLEYGRGVEGGLLALTGGEVEKLEIRVSARCHFRVELDAGVEADGVGVLDLDGEQMILNAFQGNGRFSDERMPLVEGRSDVLVAPDTADVLILFLGEREVGRRPLRLAAGDVNVIAVGKR